MNIQTDPSLLKGAVKPLPVNAAPIRSTFYHEANLRKLGEDLARKKSAVPCYTAFDFQRRIRENGKKILQVYRTMNEAQARGEVVTPAAQWLLDNYYLIEETVFQVKRDLPRRFYKELPAESFGGEAPIPRALAIAWAYVAHSDSSVSAAMFEAVVEGYQSVDPLKIGELWALPSLLRFVLIENLRRIADRVNRSRDMRLLANTLADKLAIEGGNEGTPAMLAGYAAHALDTTFATQLLHRLRDGSQSAGRALMWLEDELERHGTHAEATIFAEHQTLSSGNVTMANIVRGLRLINDVEWTVWFEEISKVDELLRKEVRFSDLDFSSRDRYRTKIEELAKGSELTEFGVAERAIALSKQAAAEGSDTADIGFFLAGDRLGELEAAIGYRIPFLTKLWRAYRKTNWVGIFVPVLILAALLLAFTGKALDNIGLSDGWITLILILSALPAFEAGMSMFSKIVLLALKPSQLIGYEYKEGVPASARTLVVVPALIGSRDDVDESLRNLEVHFLANMGGDIYFALLSDWPDSPVEQSAHDLEVLEYARAEVQRLNERHPMVEGVRFHLLHRRRLYNESEGCWMGWERKRGKLHELNMLLRNDADTTFLPSDTELPNDVIHVMTLDADTRMTRDAVIKLVGKLVHPLNRPRIDEKAGRILRGYGILQPRVTASLTTGDEASFFQRIFSAHRGLDPYVFAVSDVYQDVFDQGTFTGKGIYHVDAVEWSIKGRIAENEVLSHDLLEGAFAHAALVTDVELVEDYPTRYDVDASRQHRWARGDWQLLGYIFGQPPGVPPLSRWKMVDNLRRTLTPISWVMASIAGWTALPFDLAAQFQALLILMLFMAPTYDVIDAIVPKDRDATVRGHFSALLREFAVATAQVAMRVVLLAHTAWLMADAIGRTLYRVFVSRKHLLEWRTASQAFKLGKNTLSGYYSLMYGAVVIALVGLAIPLAAGSSGAGVAFIFALFWTASPAFAWLFSRSAETEDRLIVAEADKAKLRAYGRRTWLYFETFTTEEHNHLPPDNYQETPTPLIAPRTSATNIGVYLLSVVSARDFGWISLADAVQRLEATIGTIEKLETYRGHLYNWYETRTLKPLLPAYVSAVDSGNLAGHLVAVSAACNEWAMAPAAFLEGDFHGLLDVVMILEESLAALPDDRRQLRPLRQRLRERISGIRRAIDTVRNEPETAAIRTLNLVVLAGEIRKLATAIHQEIGSSLSEDLSRWASKLEVTAEAHVSDSHFDERAIEAMRGKLVKLRERARLIAFRMDFSFLLRRDRNLLSIGYRVEDRQLDEACYDLLASEARLASLFAIAKGDIPTNHWFRLGRPIVEIGFSGALMSWSGSMFEYLMPPLVMKEPQGGILNQTSNLIIKRQIQYGRSKGIPWGISEAAFNARDREMTYQYTNFGVPGLGLKRGLAQNTVIAPYATVLASQFRPRDAVQNLEWLRSIGGLGHFGFYDAIDFTPQRVPEGSNHAVVYNYYAHHQGMVVAAIANVIFEGRMRERFHSDPVIESAELLLQEKAPRNIQTTAVRTEVLERGAFDVVSDSPDSRSIPDPARALKATSVMSNGQYSVMVTATGAGYSRYGDVAITRWHADPTEDRMGTFLFLRDAESGEWWSATAEPKAVEGEKTRAHFSDEKACFFKTVGTLRTEVESIVISEGDGEGRRVTIWNDGDTNRFIEVTSYAELVLAPEATDNAHPAFSKMFVETEIGPENRVIFARRRPYSPSEPPVELAHFVEDSSGSSRFTEAETDRRAFIGRGRTIMDPAVLQPGARLSGNAGFVLDPILSLRRQVRVPARKKVSVTFWTVVGKTRQEVEETMARMQHPESFQRQNMLSWTRSQVQTRHIGLTLAEAANVQRLMRYLLYPDNSVRLPSEALAAGLSQQSALWPTSISGDFPIFVLRISDVSDLEIVASALRMQEYLRARGVVADLAILNEQASSYVQDLQQAIERLCDNSRIRSGEQGPRQHIFAVRRDLMDERTYRTLLSAGAIVLHTRNGPIFDQIERAELGELQVKFPATEEGEPVPSVARPLAVASEIPEVEPDGSDLAFWNGYGGFAKGGREYVVRLAGNRTTPHPWINVISNRSFGFHTSAEGASFTWSRNSRDFQLTPWSNDPVRNRSGEAIYIHDQGSGRAFSPFAAVVRDAAATYEARHGQGYSIFSATHGNIDTELTQVVDPADPVKISRLTIRNNGPSSVSLRVYAYAEWVLGTNRTRTAPFILPSQDERTGALLAHNPYALDFSERVAFLAGDTAAQSVTTDRSTFIGSGSVEWPTAVTTGATLPGTVEAGRDPCAALAHDLEISPGGEASLLFLLGDADSPGGASALVERHRDRDFGERLAEAQQTWDHFLGTLQVETPDPAFNAVVNRWLPYQALACRIRARTAFYQASGAFGFRDQLQDTLAFLLHDPSLAREQILTAASRQFPEGDVQHWWLPRTGAGVRTMISDDLVWLAYATAHYIAVTGDEAILAEETTYIEGPQLKPGEHDAFYTPEISKTKATLYEHCARALDLAIKRTGASGLPLILGGDWNDGMNRVGEKGKGESVWLGWLLARALTDFRPFAKAAGDKQRDDAWRKHAKNLKKALEAAGWDGEWYRRGSYDDGTPLGSRLSEECRIDAIAQAWSVLSGQGGPERALTAMRSGLRMLADDELQIIKLFTPPFDKTEHDPGYIKSYPPGVRENGGQYTHGAIWFVIALAELGLADEAWRCFRMLMPANHALDQAAADRYRVEPYVVAADIYSVGPLAGRGGWTWYTGSAGWLYRAAVEAILGIRRAGNTVSVKPALPPGWNGFAATLKLDGGTYRIVVERDPSASEPVMEFGGRRLEHCAFELSGDGDFEVRVRLA
ncbi:glucoamylase family protein [Mesorhizobium sp. BAC0120]|uniref:GH36-type glycosyl hydrolase domain-containing protein n=1 Tax=Mesorhizobium sp. BAC0120 TaxID=3090670 RepID=UPI00298BE6E4|nr:glucoamylase family protein [Mesorhizobium sp. BAC0120]MDW6024148.1 glucoamylase family protein [Mesorhizobium sp. BAC0120]